MQLNILGMLNLRNVLKNSKDGEIAPLFFEWKPKWLDLKVITWAAKHGQTQLLDYVFTNMDTIYEPTFEFSTHSAIKTASRFGQLTVLQAMLTNVEAYVIFGLACYLHNPWKSAVTSATCRWPFARSRVVESAQIDRDEHGRASDPSDSEWAVAAFEC